jgi:hypothetical protein
MGDLSEIRPPSEGERGAVLDHLQGLVGRGQLSLDRFGPLADEVLVADSLPALASVVQRLPGVVRFSPPERRLSEPLTVGVATGSVRLERPWQLGAETHAWVGTGEIILDLTKAEWDAGEVLLDLAAGTGQIIVTVPDGVAVRFLSVGGNVQNRLPDRTPLPGAPLLSVRTQVRTGRIVLRPPATTRPRRWFARLRETYFG